MPLPVLPPEVADAIAAEVALPLRLDSEAECDDIDVAKKTIASCALVSRQWRNIAQGHQYHDLAVEFQDPALHPKGFTIDRFRSFVEGSSRLAGSIRALHIRSARRPYEPIVYLSAGQDQTYTLTPHLAINIQHLCPVLAHLKYLQRLNISCPAFNPRKEEDAVIPHDLHIESLTDFSYELGSYYAMPSCDDRTQQHVIHGLLSLFVNVRKISLAYLAFTCPEWSTPLRTAHFNSLTHISIRNCSNVRFVLDFLYRAAQDGLYALECLKASLIVAEDVTPLRKLTSRLGSRLKHLGMQLDNVDFGEAYPQFPESSNLRSFDFAMRMRSSWDFDLCEVLKNILEGTLAAAGNGAFALETVTIWCWNIQWKNGFRPLNKGVMSALQNALLRFPFMRQVEFKLCDLDEDFDPGPFDEPDCEYIAELMPKLKYMLKF